MSWSSPKCSQESEYFKWSTITWESNDMIKVYHTIRLCSSTGLLHPSKTTSSTSIEWQLLKSVHEAIFSHEWPSYLQLTQIKQSWTPSSSAAMQLEIPLVVSHIYQDQVAKSFNILSECVRNCIDFYQFSKMTFKHLMEKVQVNFSAWCSFYFTLLNRYTYFLSPIFLTLFLSRCISFW